MTAMPRTKGSGRQVPAFASLEDEARFWDTHSPLGYPDEWQEAEEVEVRRPLQHTLAIRLDARTIDKLAAIGRQKGIGPSTLARMWLLERLEVHGSNTPAPAKRGSPTRGAATPSSGSRADSRRERS